MKSKKYIFVVLLFLLAFFVAIFIAPKFIDVSQEGRKVLYYQSGMHPWIKSDKPGKCPICGMDLVPIYEGDEPIAVDGEAPNEVILRPDQLKHLNARAEPARMLTLFNDIRAVGTVAYDPSLVVAEEEFLAALAALDEIRASELEEVKGNAESMVESARRKLEIMGLSLSQIDQIKSSRKIDDNLLLPAYSMWVYADIYEHELGLVKVGQSARVVSVAYPGQTFSGRVRAIEPIVDSRTRSARARIEVANPRLELKPQMYVDVYLKAKSKPSLAVPREAVLDTGMRKVVYVEKGEGRFEQRQVSTGQQGYFIDGGENRHFTSVVSGLSQGEKVVTAASFLIDSQSQLTGGSSALYGGASELPEGHGGH
ncbi:MAG: efflux RND transporter periplasmic adaptor subunit [Candidatus Margulisbacteria bacterium]|nr:efflux RND transporter periplasmic adaptor subunit [Candidatus Margulisiibacteriota bacterium]